MSPFWRTRKPIWLSEPRCTGCWAFTQLEYHNFLAKVSFVSKFKFPSKRSFSSVSERIFDYPDNCLFSPLAGTAFFEYTLRAVYSLDLSSQTGFPRNATSCISMRLSLAVWQYMWVRCTALCVLKTIARQDPNQIYPECCTQHKRHSNPRSFWRTGYPKIRKTQERNENPSSWHLEFLHSDTTGQFFLISFQSDERKKPRASTRAGGRAKCITFSDPVPSFSTCGSSHEKVFRRTGDTGTDRDSFLVSREDQSSRSAYTGGGNQ